jgi:hypothetical protein
MQSRHWCQLEPLTGAVELLPAGGGHRGAEGAELGAVLRQVIHVGLLALESQPVGLGRPTGLAPPRPLCSSPPSWGRSAWGRCGEGCAVSIDV